MRADRAAFRTTTAFFAGFARDGARPGRLCRGDRTPFNAREGRGRAMRKSLAIAASVTLLLGVRAHADTILNANITNDQEVNVHPTTSAGAPRSSSGTATFVLN